LRYSKLIKTLIPLHVDTPTEKSLTKEDLQLFKNYFEKVEYQAFHILARLGNWFKISDGLYGKILRFDAFMLSKFNFVRNLAHIVVLELE